MIPREPHSLVRMARFSEKNIEKKAMCAVTRMAIFIAPINHEIGSCAMVLDAVFYGVDGHVQCDKSIIFYVNIYIYID